MSKAFQGAKKPKFLNLEKYQNLEDRGFREWIYNLYIRIELLSLVKIAEVHDSKKMVRDILKKGFVENEIKQKEKLVRTPTLGDIHLALECSEDHLKLSNGSLFKELESHENKLRDRSGTYENVGINRVPEDLGEVFLKNDISSKRIQYLTKLFKKDINQTDLPVQEFQAESPYRLLRINIQSPIEQLKDEFERYVEIMRKHSRLKVSKLLTEGDITQFATNRLIPYMDLELYYKYVATGDDKRPSNNTFSIWLFEDREGNNYTKFRDGTLGLYKRIIRPEFKEYLISCTSQY